MLVYIYTHHATCAAGPESRDLLWFKSKFAWLKAYQEELPSYDWFIRGDDDTYLVGVMCKGRLHGCMLGSKQYLI
jgi:hypothetical protein